MALLVSCPTGNSRSNLAVPRTRSGKSSTRRASKSKTVRSRQAYQPTSKTSSEQFVESLLHQAGIAYTYEPRTLLLTLTGRGKEAMKPDFYLPKHPSGFEFYLEVTQGNSYRQDFKRSKIRNAMETHPGVKIVLIGPDELRELQDGHTTIWDYVDPLDD